MKLSDIYYDSHFGEFEELFRQSGVPVHFRKGEAIPTDYKIRNIFYTVNGLSKYFFVHENGTEKVTGIFGPGTLIPYSYVCRFRKKTSSTRTTSNPRP